MPARALSRDAVLPVIVSEVAGAGRRQTRESQLRALLEPAARPRFYWPPTLAELRTTVQEALRHQPSHVAVAGGDGTIHHVVNALGDADVTLVPLPFGSGNDFCRGLGLTADPARVAEVLADGAVRQVDLIEVNGKRICTVAGLGLVADTGVQVARLMAPGSRWRRMACALGQATYLAAAAGRLLAARHLAAPVRIACRTDGPAVETTSRLHGLFLANLPTLGAGLRLPVAASIDDGYFELATLPENSRLRLAASLSRLRSGRPLPDHVLHVTRAVDAEIVWEGGTALLGDGEDMGRADHFHVTLLPAALRVIAARTS